MNTLHPIKTERFNTNNAWGFGGGTGNEYIYSNGVMIRKFTASYRHAPSTKHTGYRVLIDGEWYSLEGWNPEKETLYVGKHKETDKLEMHSSSTAKITFDESIFQIVKIIEPTKYLFV